MLPVSTEERALYEETLTRDFEHEGGYKEDLRGGVRLRYITGEQCITRLNQAFGPLGWMFEIRERWYDQEADECVVMGRLTVFRKIVLLEHTPDGTPLEREVLQPIVHEQMGSQKHNRRKTVILTQQQFDNLDRSRYNPDSNYTSQPDGTWRKNDSNEILDTGFDWKGAATDSLKKCASLFGIALELSRKAAAPQRPQNNQQRPNSPPNRPAPSNAPHGANKPATAPQGADGKPFEPPFHSQAVSQPLACRARGCDVVMEPDKNYQMEIAGKVVEQTGDYIIRRAKEEAKTVLCFKHVIEWVEAKRKQGVPLAVDPKATAA